MNFKKLISRILQTPADAREIAPGVFEERRHFLWLSAGAAVPLLMGSRKTSTLSSWIGAPAAQATDVTGAALLDFKSFTAECSTLVKQAVQDPNLDQDAHTARISTLASRLNLVAVPKGKLFPYGKWDPQVELGPIHLAPPLSIIQWRLAPHAVFPPHNHSPADVVSLCTEGETRVRHFDIVGAAPEYSSPKSFLIRETRNELLTPGRMSSLTTKRDNIHTFKAGKEGALGIDINTILPGDAPFSFLSFDQPLDSGKRVYEAVWKPQPS